MKWLMSFSPDENVPLTFFIKKTENTEENTAGDHMLRTLQLYCLPDATGETATTKQSSDLTVLSSSPSNFLPSLQIQNLKYNFFYKLLVWYTKYNQKINRITQMDCKSRDKSNEPN